MPQFLYLLAPAIDRARGLVALRAHLPEEGIVSGAWFPPAIENVEREVAA